MSIFAMRTSSALNFATNTILRPFLCYAETPEPPTLCQLQNDTVLEVVCLAGSDGGLMQHFLLEVINSGPVSPAPPPSSPASSPSSPSNGSPSAGAGAAGDLDIGAGAGGVQKTVVFEMENNNELSTLNDQVRRNGIAIHNII